MDMTMAMVSSHKTTTTITTITITTKTTITFPLITTEPTTKTTNTTTTSTTNTTNQKMPQTSAEMAIQLVVFQVKSNLKKTMIQMIFLIIRIRMIVELKIGMIRWRRLQCRISLIPKRMKIKMELGFQIWQLDKTKVKVADLVEKQLLTL